MNTNRKSWDSVIIAEVGSETLKLIHAHHIKHGSCRLAKAVVVKYDQASDSSIQTLQETIRKLKISGIPVIGCLPRQAVNVRLIEIPSTDPEEIGDMVELQVGRLTPYPRDEIVVDFKIMGPGRQGYTWIMLIMVQRVLMAQRFRVLEDAGLAIESMSVSTEGLLNWYGLVKTGGKPDKETAVIIDIDAACSDVAVISSGRLLFTRSIIMGAGQATEDPAGWKEKFLQEIELSLDIYRSEAGFQQPAKIILCGAGGNIDGLAGDIHSRVNLPLQVADSMEKIQRDSGVPDMRSPEFKQLSLLPMIGLAVAPYAVGFHLVPDAVHIRRDIEVKARGLTSMGTQITLVVALLSILGVTLVQRSAAYLADLNKADSETIGVARQVEQMKQTTLMVMDRLNLKRSPLAIMMELHKILPTAVSMDSISIDADRSITLKGKAKSFPDVDNFRGNLESSSVIYPYVSSRRQTRNREGLVEFELICSMNKE